MLAFVLNTAFVVNVLLAAVAVSLIIFIHELGHFLCAKAVGMRVEVFSIGFGKKLLGMKFGETDYRISLVPLGGYVRVSGESPDESSGEPYEFWSKTPGQRAVFVVGGVVMNVVLALALFILAFGVGVEFAAARVGTPIRDEPAWKAGLRTGDEIIRVNETEHPVFSDLTRAVVLGAGEPVYLNVRRNGEVHSYRLEPERNERLGVRTIGIAPPRDTVVSGLAELETVTGRGPGGQVQIGQRAPAKEAGIQLKDRIVAIEGTPVATGEEVTDEIMRHRQGPVRVRVQRDGEQITFSVSPEPALDYIVGISGIGTTVKALQKHGLADRLGLRAGDRITAVNGQRVDAAVQLEEALHDSIPRAELSIRRGEEPVELTVELEDAPAVEDLLFSFTLETDNRLAWVKRGSPAWEAGMRPGDVVVSVAEQAVEDWDGVLRAGGGAGKEERQVQWRRNGKVFTARLKPEPDVSERRRLIGVQMGLPVSESRRYGALAAVRRGFTNMVGRVQEILLTLRGIATREVSPRHMGGIITIAKLSYHAANQGIGKLLYMTAVISAAIAFLNILPIPVLDGGHLLFLAIEKVRGRHLSERVMAIAQTVGFVLLILLVIYVTFNDVVYRVLELR
ncbi:MAG: RIP metalloprotease RseP [Planctomycetota bacterium]